MASSVAPTPSKSILQLLPARPPTPPREALHELNLKTTARRSLVLDPKSNLQTPPHTKSPTSSVSTSSNLDSGRIRKKVEWSAHTDYQEAQGHHGALKQSKSSPLSMASTVSSKPIKGILKPASSPNAAAFSSAKELDSSSNSINITEMLDSTITQLAGSDRASKLDAYMILSRALKASDNLPDRVALQNKMSLLMQFLQRDVKARLANDSLDSSLVNHSLTLLATFLHFPAIASTLTTDFGIFIIEHAIRSFKDPIVPKDVVRHLMQVIAFQNFSAKVLTSERVGRLITALHAIDTHMKGKSIVMGRLQIYKRLVKQCRTHMCSHFDWLKDLFTDMLSTGRDVRTQAIRLGMEAGYALRSEKNLLRKVTELFETADDDEQYIEYYIRKLQELIKDKQTCSAVPQIWSVVILFLRCPLDKWKYYGPWLTLAQSAFNMTDNTTKQEANYAWNQYVYLSLTDSRATSKAMNLLCQPLLSQLRRKIHPKHQDEAPRLRRAVIGGVCNLCYYAFAPGNEKYNPDVMWNIVVQPIVAQIIALESQPDTLGGDILQAAKLLVGLIDTSTPRVWRPDRIKDLPPARSDELPAIDSKWTRRNCDKVLSCVGPIVEKRFYYLSDQGDQVNRLWQVLIKSVAVASAKDIKVSEETARFVGCALGLLSKVLAAETYERSRASADPKLLQNVVHFNERLLEGLGTLPFTEVKLYMTANHTFEPLRSPSQRQSRPEPSPGIIRPALHHLIILLSRLPAYDVRSDGNSNNPFKPIVEHFLKGKSARGRFDIMNELLQLVPAEACSTYGLWILTADCAKALLNSQQVAESERLVDADYRDITLLLQGGLKCQPDLPIESWLVLLDALTSRVITEHGVAGYALIVVDPLAKAFLTASTVAKSQPTASMQRAVSQLFTLAEIPRDSKAEDAARHQLWKTPTPLPNTSSLDPLDALFETGNHFLQRTYESCEVESISETVVLLQGVDDFLRKNFTQFPFLISKKLQAGLSIWIQDSDARLSVRVETSLIDKVSAIWEFVCSQLVSLSPLETQNFGHLEPLLTAAFRSTHPSIVDRTSVALRTIGAHAETTFSTAFMSIVSSKRSIDLMIDHDLSGHRQEMNSVGVTTSSVDPHKDATLNLEDNRPPLNETECASPVLSISKRSLIRKQRLERTPETRRRKQVKRRSTPKHRHRDSQIKFEPITSSPIQDESQHLTEHQREIRERQRETMALYPDISCSLSPISARRSANPAEQSNESEAENRLQQSTPKHTKFHDSLVASTPTPRRGDFLNMDDPNDPPSSPLLPRPYPLLSEIQSRSRIDSTMEPWQFSSPPGSPARDNQLKAAELPVVPPITTSSATEQKRRCRDAGGVLGAASLPTGDFGPEASTAIDLSMATTEGSLKGTITRARKARGTPKSHRTSPGEATHRRRSSRHQALDEDVPSRVEVRLRTRETRRKQSKGAGTQASAPTNAAAPQSQEADSAPDSLESEDCIEVQPESACSSPAESASHNAPDPASPSTEGGKTAEDSQGRKRKARAKSREDETKRQRLTESRIAPQSSTSNTALASRPTSAVQGKHQAIDGMETRSRSRTRQQRALSIDVDSSSWRNSNEHLHAVRRVADGGDTDDEILNQLVTESHAASQQSLAEEASETASISWAANALGNVMAQEGTKPPNSDQLLTASREPESRTVVMSDPTPKSIMDTLQAALQQLRGMALTREKVYKMEDLLMDMKHELFEAERRGRS